jgi:hypothetical protein
MSGSFSIFLRRSNVSLRPGKGAGVVASTYHTATVDSSRCVSLLMQLATPHQAPSDVSGLERRAFGR